MIILGSLRNIYYSQNITFFIQLISFNLYNFIIINCISFLQYFFNIHIN